MSQRISSFVRGNPRSGFPSAMYTTMRILLATPLLFGAALLVAAPAAAQAEPVLWGTGNIRITDDPLEEALRDTPGEILTKKQEALQLDFQVIRVAGGTPALTGGDGPISTARALPQDWESYPFRYHFGV